MRTHLVFISALVCGCATPGAPTARLGQLVQAGQVRRAAAVCRGGQDQRCAAALARLVLLRDARHQDPRVRVSAQKRLAEASRKRRRAGSDARRRGPVDLAALRLAARGEDPYVRLRAGRALLRRGEDQPLLDAVARGLVHRRWTVRAAALNAATSARHPVARQLAARALSDPQPAVRLAAARLLLSDREVKPRAVRVARGVYALTCGGTDPWLCVQAAEVLARAGEARGLDTLRRLARRGKLAQVRAAALRAALLLGPDPGLALEALADDGYQVRHAAAWWILGTV